MRIQGITAWCGDNICQSEQGEDYTNCCIDSCDCPDGMVCDTIANECKMPSTCGNKKCNTELGENWENCCMDCDNNLPNWYQCENWGWRNGGPIKGFKGLRYSKDINKKPVTEITSIEKMGVSLLVKGNMYPGFASYGYPIVAPPCTGSWQYMYATLWMGYNGKWLNFPRRTLPEATPLAYNNPINDQTIMVIDTLDLPDMEDTIVRFKISQQHASAVCALEPSPHWVGIKNGTKQNSSESFMHLEINNDYITKLNFIGENLIGNLLEIQGSARSADGKNAPEIVIEYGYGKTPEEVRQWKTDGVTINQEVLNKNKEFWIEPMATLDTSALVDSGTYVVRLKVTKTGFAGTRFTNTDWGTFFISSPAGLTNPNAYQAAHGNIQTIRTGHTLNIQGYVYPNNFQGYEIKWSKENQNNWQIAGITLANGGLKKIYGSSGAGGNSLGTWNTYGIGLQDGRYDIKLIAYYKDSLGNPKNIEVKSKIELKFVPSAIVNTGTRPEDADIKGYLNCKLYKSNGQLIKVLYQDTGSQLRIIPKNSHLRYDQIVNPVFAQTFTAAPLETGTYFIKCYLSASPGSGQAIMIKSSKGFLVPLEDIDFFYITKESQPLSTRGISGSVIKKVSNFSGNILSEIRVFFKKIF